MAIKVLILLVVLVFDTAHSLPRRHHNDESPYTAYNSDRPWQANEMQDYRTANDYENEKAKEMRYEMMYSPEMQNEEVNEMDAAVSTQQAAWTQIGGILTDTSSSINIDWGVNRGGEVYYCVRPCVRWIKIDGDLKQVDTSDSEIWGVNYDNAIFYRPIDASSGWVHISGKLKHISASGNGFIWGVNSNNHVFKCRKPCRGGSQWSHISELDLTQVDGGKQYVFGLDTQNRMFRRPIQGTGSWEQVPTNEKMKYVTVGVYNVYAISKHVNSYVYKCALPCTDGSWTTIAAAPKCLDRIDASLGELIGTTHGGDIYHISI